MVGCTLPADTAAFTGRAQELREITVAVASAAAAGGVVAIHAIDGMPGVGKTALAVHVGHRVAGRFPDRQLFVDLHAHTAGQRPTDPTDALAVLLAADGVDPRYLPDGLEERAAMWRDRLADKRALLILDNAAGSDQVGTLRRELLDRLLIVNARHARLVLAEFEQHVNTHRPHRALGQAAPRLPLPDPRPPGTAVRVRRRDRLGGLLHEYQQVA